MRHKDDLITMYRKLRRTYELFELSGVKSQLTVLQWVLGSSSMDYDPDFDIEKVASVRPEPTCRCNCQGSEPDCEYYRTDVLVHRFGLAGVLEDVKNGVPSDSELVPARKSAFEKAIQEEIEGAQKCPNCGAVEVGANTPRTVYACGSSDYDQRPGTFRASDECHASVGKYCVGVDTASEDGLLVMSAVVVNNEHGDPVQTVQYIGLDTSLRRAQFSALVEQMSEFFNNAKVYQEK